jgi:hypothetical protein
LLVIDTVGATESTVQVKESLPTLPAASVARTVNVCDPWLTEGYDVGLVQGANALVSSLHSRVPSLAVKEKDALVSWVGSDGLEVIDTAGGIESMLHVHESAPTLPAASVALTVKVCEPWPSEEYDVGLEQATNDPASSLQLVVPSLVVNENEGLTVVDGLVGLLVIDTTGLTVSTVQLAVGGVRSC